jgi:TolB-like protein
MGERIIGYPETEVGQIEITKVRKEMSLAKITNKVTDIQEGDKAYQEMKKVIRIAITEFTYGNEFNDFTRNVQDILYTNLIQRGMTVVEREKMEQVLNELGKSFSGMIDSSTAAEIGKMLGVEAIVVGTVADMGNSVDLRTRLVDVEKSAAITAAQIDVVKDPTIAKILGTGKRPAIYGMKKNISIEEKVGDERVVPLNFKWTEPLGSWKVSLVSYQLLEDRNLKLNFLLENLEDTPQSCKFYKDNKETYLLDDFANIYLRPTTSLPEEIELIQKIPLKFSISFPKIKKEVNVVVLYLHWGFWTTGEGGRYNRRNIYFGPIELN